MDKSLETKHYDHHGCEVEKRENNNQRFNFFDIAKNIIRDNNVKVFLPEALALLRKYRDESLLPEEKDEMVNKAIALLSMCEGGMR